MKKRIGYLIKDQQEKFNLKKAWFITAWRIVDKKGNDIIQPWMDTKNNARETAKELNIDLIE